MIGPGIAFNPCCKCDEKGKCNICELTYYRNGQLADSADIAKEIFAEIEKMLLDNHIGHYKTTIDTWCYNFNNEIISEIAELKKKYIGKDTKNKNIKF